MRVVVGPVVGRVTDTAAVVLLEVNQFATVTCIACVVTAAYPQGRPVAQATLALPARRPKAFLLHGLVPGRKHVLVFSGVCAADAESRVAMFTTVLGTEPSLRVVAVTGDRPSALHPGADNPWQALHADVAAGRVDVVVHMGCQVCPPVPVQRTHTGARSHTHTPPLARPPQVYASPVFHEHWHVLRRAEEAGLLHDGGARANALIDAAAEAFRDLYRASWNMPHTREVCVSRCARR